MHRKDPNIIVIRFRKYKQTPHICFSIGMSRILSLFISESISKHATFVLASEGAEYYRYSFPKVSAIIRHLFKHRRSQILSLFIYESISKHATFVLASKGAECYRYSFPKVSAIIQHLFKHRKEPNIIAIHFQKYKQTCDIL